MGKLRQLRHWLTGQGRRIDVCEFVPQTHPLRLWADVLPWSEFVGATHRSFSRRFPKQHSGGQAPIEIRVLLGLELLKAETNCSDEEISSRSYVFWDNGGQIILAICPPTYLFYRMICEFFKI